MRQAQVVPHLVGKGGRHPDGVIGMIGYLDNRAAVLPQRDSYWGLSQPWLRRNWGKELWLDSLKYMNCDLPPVAARHHRPAAGSRQQAARGSVDFRLM